MTLPSENNHNSNTATSSPNTSITSPARGWYWEMEPSKSALAYYRSNPHNATCLKCGPGYGFTKDSNGSGLATYGCFRCKNCATKYKALQFWTECLSLSADLLPANNTQHKSKWASCSASEINNLPTAEVTLINNESTAILATSSGEPEYSGYSSNDKSSDIQVNDVFSVERVYQSKHPKRRKAHSPSHEDKVVSSAHSQINILENSLKSVNVKLQSFDSKLEKLTLLIENLLGLQTAVSSGLQSSSALDKTALAVQKSLVEENAQIKDTCNSQQRELQMLKNAIHVEKPATHIDGTQQEASNKDLQIKTPDSKYQHLQRLPKDVQGQEQKQRWKEWRQPCGNVLEQSLHLPLQELK
ncbi:hypothetical protein K493DRAFT_308907 [Basidiobolus meristosporus CBS 931.73]|uniref:Uncharacterized protein n=1 Tax=Basidiobolus meristosporus CBS 931.73 TaxID=1314790 RepID=A0A1Y1WV29_9FUNG|nr:hypothetical protein K493DRAFT_308907 [Basidiobolus meristosporus CBS 931.73]|eukprot:ORX77400.1 hypothetical protein K493DRAFT_308907 [Basidiobolus meristosporus CBS 931.73]